MINFRKIFIQVGIRIFSKYIVLSAVPVIITNPKGQILLGKRSEKAIYYSGLWGLPGGIIGHGEKVKDAAKREVKEEMGVDCKFVKYGKVFMQMPVKNYPAQSMNVPVYCRIIRGKPQPKDETPEVGWFSAKQINHMELVTRIKNF